MDDLLGIFGLSDNEKIAKQLQLVRGGNYATWLAITKKVMDAYKPYAISSPYTTANNWSLTTVASKTGMSAVDVLKVFGAANDLINTKKLSPKVLNAFVDTSSSVTAEGILSAPGKALMAVVRPVADTAVDVSTGAINKLVIPAAVILAGIYFISKTDLLKDINKIRPKL